MNKKGLADFYSGIEVIKNGVAYDKRYSANGSPEVHFLFSTHHDTISEILDRPNLTSFKTMFLFMIELKAMKILKRYATMFALQISGADMTNITLNYQIFVYFDIDIQFKLNFTNFIYVDNIS